MTWNEAIAYFKHHGWEIGNQQRRGDGVAKHLVRLAFDWDKDKDTRSKEKQDAFIRAAEMHRHCNDPRMGTAELFVRYCAALREIDAVKEAV